jgi:hypothetical protein
MAELDKPGSEKPSLEVVVPERAVEVPSEPYYFDDLKEFGWFSIAASIVLAGAVYPMVVAAGIVAVMLLVEGPPSSLDPMGFLGSALMIGVMVAGIGSLWSGIVSIFTLPVLHLIVWSLTLRINLVRLGAFAGGLVGFIAVLPMTISVSSRLVTGYALQAVLGLFMGPGIATIVGQFGGARGGRRAEWQVEAKMASRRALARIGRLRPRRMGELRADDGAEEFDDGIDVPRFRFRTIHLLWLGVWVSLLLTIIRMSRIPFELILPVLLVWMVFQAATLALGNWLLPRVTAAWQSEQQNRST